MKSKSDDRKAALERENAELRRQLAESLAQQQATGEVLAVIARPGVELAVVLQTVVAAAHRLCRADHSVLFRKDGDVYRWAAGHAMAEGAEEHERNAVIRPGTGTLIGRAVLEGRPVQIEDAWTDPHYEAKEGAREGGIHTMLGVPLMREGEAIGAMGLARGRIEPFTDKEIALVQSFADQAVIAIENARLLTETREALDQQTATAEVLQVISRSAFELDTVFATLATSAIRLCQADHAGIYRKDGGEYRWAGGYAPNSDYEANEHTIVMRPGDGSLVGRVAAEVRVVQIEDVWSDPDYPAQDDARTAGIHTLLGVPLLHDGVAVGVIGLARKRIERFTAKQVELVTTFADQAVIAMENARLLTETREALEQQTATAEVLQVINSSPGELAPVFDAMLEKALHLCEADFGILWRTEGERLHALALHDVPEGFAETVREPFVPDPRSGPGRILRGADVAISADIAATPQYREGVPNVRALADLAGARSVVMVRMHADDVTLGAITIYRTEVRPFTEKQVALLQNFAAQAVIAMENARLLTETRESLERQTATSDILRVIAASPGDAAGTLRKIAETTMRLFNAAGTSFRIADGDAHSSAIIVGRGAEDVSASLSDPEHLVRPLTLPGTVIHENRQIHLPDLDNLDPAFADWPGPPVFRKAGMRTLVGTPLRRQDQAFGVLIVYREELRPFTPEELQLLQSFADQAVIAMENARLLTETREALEQQTATAEVLQVINASPGDLAPVFDAMLERALRLSDAAYGNLLRYDGDLFHVVAAVHREQQMADRHLHRPPFRATPKSLLDRIVQGEPFVSAPNVRETETYRSGSQQVRELIDKGGYRGVLNVELRKDGVLVGVMQFYRQEARPFTDKQIALLQNFAQQAVIAMESARLLTETREALEQQTATAEVLQVINSSPGDLAPVLEAMVEKARRLCDADSGHIALPQGTDDYRTAAVSAVSPEMEAVIRAVSYAPGRGTAVGRALQERQPVQIADIGADSEHVARHAATQGFIKTILGVPLLLEGEPVGAFGLSRTRVELFTDRQIELVKTFAAQAVIAMENARLITETREALEQQTATAEVLQVINSSPGDLAPVFDAILERAHTVCGAAYGSLNLNDNGHFRAVAIRGVGEQLADVLRQPYLPGPDSPTARLIAGDRYVEIPDLAEHVAKSSHVSERNRATAAAGFRTLLFVPLRKEDQLLGFITARRLEVRPFSEREIALIENFAAQAVIAMENARLITETREALDQQTATAEVLGVINSSPGDLAPVFDAILAKAHALCDAGHGTLFVADGAVFKLAAVHDAPEPIEQLLRQHGLGPDAPAVQPLLDGAPFVHIPDMTQLDHPVVRAAVANGVRTLLSVPLRKAGLIGIIIAVRFEVRPFTDKQIALLQDFAAQAVIAMENARLLGELRQRTDEVAELNRGLEARVAEQVDEIGRVGRLKRFLAPQLAELIVSQGDEKILESHRREIVVVFCDLRGYTAFTETAEPEEVLDFLREYHGALGPLVAEYEGTLDQFSGDGIMVFFNDPVPIPDPAERAVKMAMAMREAATSLTSVWRRRGRELGFGAGIAQGYATLGQIGFSERSGYTAIGTVCNVAARLCAEAKDGQILIAQRVAAGLDGDIALEDVGALPLKGITQPVVAFNVAPSGAAAGRLRLV